MVTITSKPCIMCGKTHEITVPRRQFDLWQSGTFVQHAFPDMSTETRELLISGTCPPCFNKLFPPDED